MTAPLETTADTSAIAEVVETTALAAADEAGNAVEVGAKAEAG